MRTKWWWVLLLLIVVLLVVAAVWAARIVGHAWWLKARLDALQAMAEGNLDQVDRQAAIALVHGLHADVTALQSDVRPFLWLTPYLGWVPRYGGDIQASPHLLAMGSALMDSADILLDAFSPLLEDAPGDPIQRGLQALSDARPDLRAARAQLEAAAEARARVDAGRLSPRVRGWVDRLDRYLPLAEMAVEAGMSAPGLLGVDGPRTYLILAQNDDELRPTGGFITGVGLIQVEGGSIAELSFADSYAVDDFSKPYPAPPRPLWDYMLAELWLFRDSNWSPDFPTAAGQVAYFYEYGTGQVTDGVIALDTQALRLLVEALEPLRIPGAAEPITGDNVVDWIRQARGGAPPGEEFMDWLTQRKDFIGPLALALRLRLEKGEVDWPTLARAVEQGLQEKHILVYVADPEAAALLSRQGWDGAVSSPVGDYLLVVDSNLGFNKVNPLVNETLEYRVSLGADGLAQGELQIGYHNRSQGSATDCDPAPRYGADYIADMHRCYWDYLRVYVPEGSRLTVATPAPLPEASLYHRKWGRAGRETLTIGPPELGKQVFAVYLLIPRGESREQRFQYGLPQGAVRREGEDWVYALKVQKQPGSRAWPLTVTIVLPEGAHSIASDPAPTEQRGSEIIYRWRLDRDRTLQIRYCLQE
jgi:hypothetical protein